MIRILWRWFGVLMAALTLGLGVPVIMGGMAWAAAVPTIIPTSTAPATAPTPATTTYTFDQTQIASYGPISYCTTYKCYTDTTGYYRYGGQAYGYLDGVIAYGGPSTGQAFYHIAWEHLNLWTNMTTPYPQSATSYLADELLLNGATKPDPGTTYKAQFTGYFTNVTDPSEWVEVKLIYLNNPDDGYAKGVITMFPTAIDSHETLVQDEYYNPNNNTYPYETQFPAWVESDAEWYGTSQP